MKKYYCFSFLYVALCWAVPKPMEAIPNYNVMMVHGAYGSDKGIQNCSDSLPVEAALATGYLSTSKDAANIGYYNDRGRLANWLDSLIFEDYVYDANGNPYIDEEHLNSSPYIYSWRAFVNPANSSINNARELGDRKWHGCGKRRALIEEVQEVRVPEMIDANGERKDKLRLKSFAIIQISTVKFPLVISSLVIAWVVSFPVNGYRTAIIITMK